MPVKGNEFVQRGDAGANANLTFAELLEDSENGRLKSRAKVNVGQVFWENGFFQGTSKLHCSDNLGQG